MSDVERIAEATRERTQAQAELDRKDVQWRGLIAAAVKGGRPIAEIAEAAGISRQRVYQIRDGRR